MVLFFFNLLPIPPLDGSQIMQVLVGMSYGAMRSNRPVGFLIIILVINFTPVPKLLGFLIGTSMTIMGGWFGMW